MTTDPTMPDDFTGPSIPEASVEDELTAAWNEVARYRDALLRFRGEFSNYRRRIAAAREQEVANASAVLIRQLLPVVDDFARAAAALPGSGPEGDWAQGVLAIERKLAAALAASGLEPIVVTPGELFDPHYHEALSTVEGSPWPEGGVVDEVRRGYRLGSEVLRPSLVRVAKGRHDPVGDGGLQRG